MYYFLSTLAIGLLINLIRLIVIRKIETVKDRSFVKGYAQGEETERKNSDRSMGILRGEAVRYGYAKWNLANDRTGETTFEWLEPKEETPVLRGLIKR